MKIQTDSCNLCFRRGDDRAPMVQAVAAPVAMPVPAAVAAPAAPAEPGAIKAEPKKLNTIDSPLVGTFYKAASPDSAPFVQVGDRVTADTVVCIIEAMKVMNEVKAEKSGVIKEILIDNANPVEFGQPMFVLG